MESLNAWSHLSDDVLSMTHALTCLHSLFCKLTVFGLLAENLILDLLGLIGKVGICTTLSFGRCFEPPISAVEATSLEEMGGIQLLQGHWNLRLWEKICRSKVEFTYGESNHLQFFLWQFRCNLHLSTVFWGLLGWVLSFYLACQDHTAKIWELNSMECRGTLAGPV